MFDIYEDAFTIGVIEQFIQYFPTQVSEAGVQSFLLIGSIAYDAGEASGMATEMIPEVMGEGDEENNYYSLGGPDKDALNEGKEGDEK